MKTTSYKKLAVINSLLELDSDKRTKAKSKQKYINALAKNKKLVFFLLLCVFAFFPKVSS